MFLLTQSTHRMLVQYHPAVGHLYVPNQTARIPSERGGYFVRTNAQGFRSDVEFAKQGGNRRILFFGDSFTAGDWLRQRGAVQRASRTTARCGGLQLWAQRTPRDQQLLVYEHLARDVTADLVVFCIQVENIERNQLDSRPSIDRATGRSSSFPSHISRCPTVGWS